MTKVKPGKQRSLITNKGDTIIIKIPSKKNVFFILFIFAFFIGWLIGEISVLLVFIGFLNSNAPILFLIIWFIIWTIAGYFTTYALLWNIFGIEFITFSNDNFVIRKNILLFNFNKEYILSDCNNFRLRTSRPPYFSFKSSFDYWRINTETISFDYGMETHHFANSIDEAEALYIINLLIKKNYIKND